MKWQAIKQASPSVQVFQLVDNNSIKEVLRYHVTQQSVRLTCNQRQRVYFIEQAGFRNSQYVFKNEYGFEAGRIYAAHTHDSGGFIDNGETKLQYTFQFKPIPELVLYEEDGLKPKLVCAIQPSTGGMKTANIFGAEHACLLWGMYWYLPEIAGNKNPAESHLSLTGNL